MTYVVCMVCAQDIARLQGILLLLQVTHLHAESLLLTAIMPG